MIYRFEEYELDLQRYELRYASRLVKIEPQVFNLLAYLIRHRDRLITKEELLEQLWAGRVVGEATLNGGVSHRAGDRGSAEDLHWSDASTIDLIALLARRREPARLLLLATYRPAEIMLHAHPLQTVKQELGVHGQCHELALPLLTEVEVEAYLDVRFPGVMFPPEMTQFLHQRTDGNPLFVGSVVDHWQGQGLSIEMESPVQLLEWFRGLTAEVPDTLRKLIEQQLGQLGRDDQRLLEAASVAGKEFGTAVVAAAVDRTTEHVETCLDALARRGQFVRAHGVAAWPDGTLASRYTFIHDLYRAALYDRVPAGQRAQRHRHIGLRLEAGYESRAPELATELAEHFARGRDTERALRYLQCAGENALRRSAYHEAIAHLTRSLELLPDLPVTPARTLQELHLQVALGAALTANKGFASAEGGHAYTRARELAPQVAETPRSAPILLGLWVYYHVCAELQTAHTLGEEILRQAQTWHDPILLNQAHHALGITSTDLGRFTEALRHLQQAVALYTVEQHRAHLELSVYDTGVICRAFAAHNLWYLGNSDQAARQIHEALTLAQELGHPYTTMGTLGLAAVLATLRGEWQRAQEEAEAVVTLSYEHGFPYFAAWGTILRGSALSAQGQHEAGIAQLRLGLEAYHATGSAALQTYWAGLLVEALKRAGASEEGLCVLDNALAAIPRSGERCSEAELYRLRGGLLQHLQGNKRHVSLTPEVCFQRAIDIARRQQAKGLELRAAMSLNRLWRQQGQHQAAQQLLRDTLVWFSEGVDTADASTSEAERRALSPVTRGPKPTSLTSHPSPPSSVSVVGCEAALAQLHGWLQGACDGARQIVFITGEAGLGKTTVVDTFIEEVRGRGLQWIGRGQCIEHYGDAAFGISGSHWASEPRARASPAGARPPPACGAGVDYAARPGYSVQGHQRLCRRGCRAGLPRALTLAQDLAHPYSMAMALDRASFLGQFRREGHGTHQWAETAVGIAAEHGFRRHAALGPILRGWAQSVAGQAGEGIPQIRQGINPYREVGMAMEEPYFLALLAEAQWP